MFFQNAAYFVNFEVEFTRIRCKLIPLFRLSKLFDVIGAEQDISNAIVIIVENHGRKTGLLADELLGQQQIVIKSLDDTLRNTPGISGGAIMPDGQVGMILDISSLVKLANTEKQNILI